MPIPKTAPRTLMNIGYEILPTQAKILCYMSCAMGTFVSCNNDLVQGTMVSTFPDYR